MKLVAGTKAQIRALAKAFNRAANLPVRGVTVGGPDSLPSEVLRDANDEPLPTPGFTTEALAPPVEAGTSACVEIPEEFHKYLGRTVTIAGKSITLPTLAELLADEDALPAALKAARAALRAPSSTP